MDAFNWIIATVPKLFGIFNTLVLGVPAYAYFILAFVFMGLAKFMYGRK